MLQHSRSSTGIKEPTDINALAEEYIKLAYHGFRAKDKTFNVTLKTDFDEGLGPVNVIPQDIGTGDSQSYQQRLLCRVRQSFRLR